MDNRHIHLLPVIVTALGREEAKTDLDQAQRLGVVVVTEENIRSGLNQSVMLQNADLIFSRAEDDLRNIQNQMELRFPQAEIGY